MRILYQYIKCNICHVLPAESSAQIKEQVNTARVIQREGFKNKGIFHNSQISHKQVRQFCLLGIQKNELLKTAMDELNFNARAYDKKLKVARTIADLAGCADIKPEHLSKAIQYRNIDEDFFT